mgnify:CR=1 FL=1
MNWISILHGAWVAAGCAVLSIPLISIVRAAFADRGKKPVAEPDWFYAMDTGCGTCAPKLLSGLVLVDGEEPVTFSVK